MQLQKCHIFTHFAVVFLISSSYLGPSGGNYGVINNSRIKRRPSSHFEMEINECEFLWEQIKNKDINIDTAIGTACEILLMELENEG